MKNYALVYVIAFVSILLTNCSKDDQLINPFSNTSDNFDNRIIKIEDYDDNSLYSVSDVKYNADGQITQITETLHDLSFPEPYVYSRTMITYSANTVSKVHQYSWEDNGQTVWEDSRKETIKTNSDEKVVSITYQDSDGSGGWESVYLTETFTYNGDKMSTYTSSYEDGYGWRYTATYDENGRLSRIVEDENAQGQSWEVYGEMVYSYDEDNKLQTLRFNDYDASSQSFEAYWGMRYEYNDDDRVSRITEEEFDNGQWVSSSSAETFKYDQDGRLIESSYTGGDKVVYSYEDGNGNAWIAMVDGESGLYGYPSYGKKGQKHKGARLKSPNSPIGF